MGGAAGVNKIFERSLYPYIRHPDQDKSEATHHTIAIIGAGPVGLAAAIDLTLRGIPVVIIDDNDKVSFGSRAICFAKRTLEICDRLGIGDQLVDKGIQWNLGKVFFNQRKVYEFNLLAEEGHQRPAFINLQQYYVEVYLFERLTTLKNKGGPVDIRGKTRVNKIHQNGKKVHLSLQTPEGSYQISADWVIACDGANSPSRQMLGQDFIGRVFEDNFLIADVTMEADFPTERWFWFDPPFNKGQSALLHKQPDNVWRVDLQLGRDVDREEERKPENVIPRLKAMLGEDIIFELEWVSIYTFQCRRMERFLHNRVIFAGDSAHQVSPFGARGANSGIQDVDNLCWKLAEIVNGNAPEFFLESYNTERVYAANENIINSTRSTDFITPKSDVSRLFRDAVLELSADHAFARPLVNSGRLSVPSFYPASTYFSYDVEVLPSISRPGAACPDAIFDNGSFLLKNLGFDFTILAINVEEFFKTLETGPSIKFLSIKVTGNQNKSVKDRFLGDQSSAIYLIRPDQHIAGRWLKFDRQVITKAIDAALGR